MQGAALADVTYRSDRQHLVADCVLVGARLCSRRSSLHTALADDSPSMNSMDSMDRSAVLRTLMMASPLKRSAVMAALMTAALHAERICCAQECPGSSAQTEGLVHMGACTRGCAQDCTGRSTVCSTHPTHRGSLAALPKQRLTEQADSKLAKQAGKASPLLRTAAKAGRQS